MALSGLASGALVWYFADPAQLANFQVLLVGAPITITFFAINFALATFQNSGFKVLYSSISPRLTLGAFVCFLVGILPIISLSIEPSLGGKIGLAMIPVAFVSSFVLHAVARSDTNPIRLIRRATRRGKWRRFMKAYFTEAKRLEGDPGCKQLVHAQDKPVHEIDWKLTPQIDRPNPGDVVSGIGELALKSRDETSFLAAIQTLIESEELIVSAKPEGVSYFEISDFYLDPLRKLFLGAQQEPSEKLTETAIDLVSGHILRLIKERAPNYRSIVGPLIPIYRASLHWMEQDRAGPAKKALILFRQLWQYGLNRAVAELEEDEGKTDADIESFFFSHNLNQMAHYIEGLGSKAIQQKDSGFLHLVHEGLGFQGCSAVKHNAVSTGEECIRILAQLGREARAAKLECHWEKCAALPHDHAIERINWIWSWISKIEDAKTADRWVDRCLAGISRIEGKKFEVIDRGIGKEPRWELKRTDEAYTESFSGLDGSRLLDYSDPEMLKSFTLIGAGKGLIQGTPVPILGESKSDRPALS